MLSSSGKLDIYAITSSWLPMFTWYWFPLGSLVFQDYEKQLPPPCVLRTWTTASQHAFWAWRFAHWERKKLKDCQVCPCQRLSVVVFLRVSCCVQAACRQLGLWPGGDLRDIRRRLTLHEYAPSSLSAIDFGDFHTVNHQTICAC